MSGVRVSAIYGLGEEVGSSSAGSAFGVAGQYTNGPFGIGAGYYQAKLGKTPADFGITNGFDCATGGGVAGDTCVKTWSVVGNYQAGPANLYASWSHVKQPLASAGAAVAPLATVFGKGVGGQFTIAGTNNDKIDTLDIGVNYALNSQLTLLAAAQQSRANFIGASKGKLTQFNLGADYAFSKRTDVYALVANLHATDMYNPGMFNQNGGGSVGPGADNSQTAFQVGIRHKF
ncbi:porin [Undibacterium arcticum]